MIGHAMFDLDGTLVDSASVCTTIMNDMLADRGAHRRLGCAEVRPLMSIGGATMIARLFGEECGDPIIEIAEFRARYADTPTPPDSLFCGVHAGLARLYDEGVVLSICSNKPQNLCEKVLAELDLAKLFTAIVGSSDNLPKKPHPAMFEAALAAAGGTVDQCCFIGDSELDFEIANAAGVPFVFVGHGYAEGDHFPDAVRCVDFIAVADHVLAILERLGRRTPPRISQVA